MSELLPFVAHVAGVAVAAGLVGLAIGWTVSAR